ncbi:CatB-related O-acetyltransferase [uncultured Fusobacterium sp.]|uniref:CatB-related O-acetyltransferase n=1 Tax=uncultured Fusobacterium sp. TaxID=159267 RepID=UPI0015A5268F|nr:CatB-related O-acetyltransferase [uncultured Fusobacterium sp.]
MKKKLKLLIKKIYYKIKYYDKNIILKKKCNIGGFHTIFHGNNVIGENTEFTGEIGYGSYIGNESQIYAKIGKYCSISNDVRIVVGNHPTKKYVSTHPSFFSIRKQAGFTYVQKNSYEEISFAINNYPVLIGNDVWIGNGVKILNGVIIGDGAIIAAGSMVVKNVAPYSIVGGVPAKEIKKRFTDEQIQKLLKIKWWNNSEKWIKEFSKYFNDISLFLNKVQED